MKRILFTILIANALIILSLSSCEKGDLSSGPVLIPPASNPPPITLPVTINLVANNWVNYGGQVYVNTFKGVISAANANGNRTVKVYLVENNEEILINYSPITFMGNELWATNSPTDVSLIYRCNAPSLPFNSLNIRVVVE